MVRSDGNGAYIVDKWIWKAAISLILILLGITGLWGQSILSTVDGAIKSIHANEIVDARQDEQYRAIMEHLARMEQKIDNIDNAVRKK